jgi:hypothetical protein
MRCGRNGLDDLARAPVESTSLRFVKIAIDDHGGNHRTETLSPPLPEAARSLRNRRRTLPNEHPMPLLALRKLALASCRTQT